MKHARYKNLTLHNYTYKSSLCTNLCAAEQIGEERRICIYKACDESIELLGEFELLLKERLAGQGLLLLHPVHPSMKI